jgi:hypothetical protein
MNGGDILLNAVNWEHGMLLTPEHFLRQERYFDSALLWALRYATSAFGLVGGGARLPENERGAVRHDPIVTLSEDLESISISVTQCRALTPAGCVIEITPEGALHRRFLKTELEGVNQAGIYITSIPYEKEIVDGPVDEANPQMRTERRNFYRLSLLVSAQDAPFSVAVARIRRAQAGAGYEKDRSYIPPCASMASFSELAAGWRRIVEEITALADRHIELNRAMQQYLVLFRERGIDTELDRETIGFVNRMVVALEDCIFEILDPTQPPQLFFSRLKRLFHSTAVYFDLSPPVQQYFGMLHETGETEFLGLLERQRAALAATRKWEIHDDLALEVRAARESISSLARLERALEGKYIDFRLSPSLEAMNFIFDRGGKVLYKLAAKPSRLQGFADELTIHFAGLRLEGRDRYRLVLASEPGAKVEPGTRLNVEIRINEGAGFHRPPVNLMCQANLLEQRNFEFDFEAPDVPTITDLRVSLPAVHPIRTALLFARHRFYADAAPRVAPEAEALRSAPAEIHQPAAKEPQPPPAPASPRPVPWDVPRRPDRPGVSEPRPADRHPEPPRDVPRRRRLE